MDKSYFAAEVTEDVSYDLSGEYVTSTVLVPAKDSNEVYRIVASLLQEHLLGIRIRPASWSDLKTFRKITSTT